VVTLVIVGLKVNRVRRVSKAMLGHPEIKVNKVTRGQLGMISRLLTCLERVFTTQMGPPKLQMLV